MTSVNRGPLAMYVLPRAAFCVLVRTGCSSVPGYPEGAFTARLPRYYLKSAQPDTGKRATSILDFARAPIVVPMSAERPIRIETE